MQYNNTHMIIMAGGVGSRFWPMSTPDYPKQFIDVMGVGRSLIQLTVDRLKPICPVENIIVTYLQTRNSCLFYPISMQGSMWMGSIARCADQTSVQCGCREN